MAVELRTVGGSRASAVGSIKEHDNMTAEQLACFEMFHNFTGVILDFLTNATAAIQMKVLQVVQRRHT